MDVIEEVPKNDAAKWCWKMDYCKKHQLPPAQQWAWQQAEDAWSIYTNQQITENLLVNNYVVVKEYSLKDLQKEVNKFIANGWLVSGGLSVILSEFKMIFYQAMVKP